jgi:hypothetical protein
MTPAAKSTTTTTTGTAGACAALPAQSTHHSSRHEAPEHSGRGWRNRQAVRLWLCTRNVQQHAGADKHQGHAAVHGARAGAGAALQSHGAADVAS